MAEIVPSVHFPLEIERALALSSDPMRLVDRERAGLPPPAAIENDLHSSHATMRKVSPESVQDGPLDLPTPAGLKDLLQADVIEVDLRSSHAMMPEALKTALDETLDRLLQIAFLKTRQSRKVVSKDFAARNLDLPASLAFPLNANQAVNSLRMDAVIVMA